MFLNVFTHRNSDTIGENNSPLEKNLTADLFGSMVTSMSPDQEVGGSIHRSAVRFLSSEELFSPIVSVFVYVNT